MANKYVCPKCESDKTIKERVMGSDTQDRECTSCGYIGHLSEFLKKDGKSDD